jgi:hypothetical protein
MRPKDLSAVQRRLDVRIRRRAAEAQRDGPLREQIFLRLHGAEVSDQVRRRSPARRGNVLVAEPLFGNVHRRLI